RMRFPVILDEQRWVGYAVVLVLAGSMIEGPDGPEEVVRHRQPSHVPAELEVPVPAELIHDVYPLPDELAAELNIVAPMHPTRPVAPLKASARELRLQVVADIEKAHRLNLRNGRLGRIERQPDPQFLHARHARKEGSPRRMDAVEPEVK